MAIPTIRIIEANLHCNEVHMPFDINHRTAVNRGE
jgi:hypothetical protein